MSLGFLLGTLSCMGKCYTCSMHMHMLSRPSDDACLVHACSVAPCHPCRKGMDLYFKRHDGQAVTCDDFLAAMADANGVELSSLSKW